MCCNMSTECRLPCPRAQTVQGMGQVIPGIHVNIAATLLTGLILKGKGIARLAHVYLSYDDNYGCFMRSICLIFSWNDFPRNWP